MARCVVHADVRAENILVDNASRAVWIVDFEFSHLTGNLDAQSRIDEENQAIKYLISKIRAEAKENGNIEN